MNSIKHSQFINLFTLLITAMLVRAVVVYLTTLEGIAIGLENYDIGWSLEDGVAISRGALLYRDEWSWWPPLQGYTMAILIKFFGSSIFIARGFVVFIDLCIIYTLFKVGSNVYNERAGTLASYFYAFYPLIIETNAMYSHFDNISTLFALLSVYLLLSKRQKSSAFFLGVAIMYKWWPVVLLLPAGLYLWNKKIKVVPYFIYVGTVVIMISLPFLVLSPVQYFSMLAIQIFREPGGASILMMLSLVGLNHYLIASLLLGGEILLFVLFAKKILDQKNPEKSLISNTLLILATVIFFNKVIHQQYLIWMMPFLALRIGSLHQESSLIYRIIPGDKYYIFTYASLFLGLTLHLLSITRYIMGEYPLKVVGSLFILMGLLILMYREFKEL